MKTDTETQMGHFQVRDRPGYRFGVGRRVAYYQGGVFDVEVKGPTGDIVGVVRAHDWNEATERAQELADGSEELE